MKSKKIKLTVILLIFMLMYGCDRFDTESPAPGISIYKTKGDYFNLVDIGMKGDEIFRTDMFWNARYNSIDKLEVYEGDTIYRKRYKLPNGYILDAGADHLYDVFLNITFKEQLYRELSGDHPGMAMPHDTIRKYIVDKDPYTEFYRNKADVKRFYMKDSLEIKEILLNGEIEKYFEKLK